MNEVRTVALLPWGEVIEDFLDGIGVTLETFCTTMTGGWLFGYISALDGAGVQTNLICFSASVRKPTAFVHAPTGARVTVLPASRAYRWLRQLKNGGKGRMALRMLAWPFVWTSVTGLLPYLATPIRPLATELHHSRYAAIICQEYEYPRFDACVLVGKLLGIPVFGSFQGGNFRSGRLENLVRPLSMRWCKGVIIGSRDERVRVSGEYGMPSSKIAKIFNPLDVNAWHANDRALRRQEMGFQENTVVVVWHGRVNLRRKGLDTLLDAWRIVEDAVRGEEVPQLLLVGTGNDADSLEKGIRERGLKRVLWRNQYVLDHEEIRGCLAAADLYVLPSRHEGFAVAPLEAMACGLPIIATDVPGVSDILEERELSGGFIVPPDDPHRLAQALDRMLRDPHLRKTMGERARRRVETAFSWQIVGEQLRSFMLDAARGTGVTDQLRS